MIVACYFIVYLCYLLLKNVLLQSATSVPEDIFISIYLSSFIRKSGDQGISSWDWNLSGQHSTYHALFPRAWTVYDGVFSKIVF